MGAVKLCVHERARVPYALETTGIHIYSIEELAYYLCENIYLADDRIIGEKLYTWLECELKLPGLAEKLRSGNNMGNHVYNQVMLILQASDYYSEEELIALSEKIKAISSLQTQERMKYKADELLQNENYWAAVEEYERILSIRQNSKLSVQIYADIWNNLGVCYAKMFLFQKAAGCFENAYGFQKISKYKEKAFYARSLAVYGQEEAEALLETKISEEFVEETKIRLKELEGRAEEASRSVTAEKFLEDQEKEYAKISCI